MADGGDTAHLPGAHGHVHYSGGNDVRLLRGGDELFPAMCAALAAARHEVWLASYIFHNDPSAATVVDALVAKLLAKKPEQRAQSADDVVAMLSLETLGYYRDGAGTQKYPPVVSWFYPDRADFVAFVGNLGSRGLVHDAIRTFRGAAAFPSEGAALPSFVTGVGWSDQWSFWQVGYPGVMVTDTAPFRNPNYHQPGDRPDTLDYGRLARVVEGLVAVVKKLGD